MPHRTISLIAFLLLAFMTWGLFPLMAGTGMRTVDHLTWAGAVVTMFSVAVAAWTRIKTPATTKVPEKKEAEYEYCTGFNRVNVRLGKLESRVVKTETENSAVSDEIKEMRVDIRWIRDNLFKVNE